MSTEASASSPSAPFRIGIDLMRVDELAELLGRSWFRRYAYTAAELGHARGLAESRAREFLAGRFAAKEATVKALGCGFSGGLRPRHIGIVRDPQGSPRVRLTDAAGDRARRDGVRSVLVSVSHKGQVVAAAALALSNVTYAPAFGPENLDEMATKLAGRHQEEDR